MFLTYGDHANVHLFVINDIYNKFFFNQNFYFRHDRVISYYHSLL